MEPWIVGSNPSNRYPLWTRANVGEVFPDPVAPLTFTTFMEEQTEGAWRDALVQMGAFTHDEFAPGEMETLGVFGGYCYLNASVTRILGERGPGLSAQMMDDLFFGAQPGIPPYEVAAGDQNEERTAAIGAVFQWAMTTDRLDIPAEAATLVDSIRAARPNLEAMTNQELWEYARKLYTTYLRRFFGEHIFITFISTVPVGALTQICAAVGRPEDAMRLISGVGDVESAAPSMAMWKLGRMVASDPSLTAAFDEGIDGLAARLKALGPAGSAFNAQFEQFIKDYGSRGPNEWEIRSNTWETRPELALAAIDRMRLAPAPPGGGGPRFGDAWRRTVPGRLPPPRRRERPDQQRSSSEARDGLPWARGTGLWLEGGEMDAWLKDPRPLRAEIARRRDLMAAYANLQEPFVFWGTQPDVSTWPARGATAIEPVKAGDVLTGFPGCPGQVTGVARVILDPIDPTALEPGDILVAPITDPSWTPLFVSAGGVIVDVGAAQSHAMIVSRELGIPCVPSVTNGTRRIPNGATVTVNGDAGTVTIVALP
ncbi:PEP-utilizing enzyme [Candidatus Amarobacter glycogenicus]|uniref:PEP-utilizing enzyme n=1 Tax=Candidatus Amarobacter glycogenicus TaxID=3140699 RepID=UPI0031CCD197